MGRRLRQIRILRGLLTCPCSQVTLDRWRTHPSPRSALKHGLGESEILHAYRNPDRIWDLGDGFITIVGPNQAAIFWRLAMSMAIKCMSSSTL